MDASNKEKRKKTLIRRRLENQFKTLKRIQKMYLDNKAKNSNFKSELLDEFFGEGTPKHQ